MLSHIEYIYAVYQERSFSKAARRLYVSQPWLSAAVKKTEKELGVQIFDRSTSPISLTEEGEYYIRQIERILAVQEEIKEHFSELSAASTAHLRIGSSMFFCTYVLPSMLEEFRQLYPNIALTFEEGVTSSLFEQLRDGSLDFVLEAERADSADFSSEEWCTEEVILAVPTDRAVNAALTDYGYTFEEFLNRNKVGASKPCVPLSAFAQEKFILLGRGNDIHERSMAICKNAAFTPHISLYVSQMMTAYYLVCEGSGVSFLRSTIPEYVTPTDRVRFYQLDDPLTMRSIYLTHVRKKQTRIQQTLSNFIEERRVIPE